MLRGLDVLVVDLQDVGSRYYTFVWTMTLAMHACGRADLPVVVLDRPNPLGGIELDGNVADPAYASFVGRYPLAVRHGMTIAELAGYLNATHGFGAALTVVPMDRWRRAMEWEETGLPWVLLRPNMPTPAARSARRLPHRGHEPQGRGTTPLRADRRAVPRGPGPRGR
jgi:uncharacterized protein YbbC (DUF1343 family)